VAEAQAREEKDALSSAKHEPSTTPMEGSEGPVKEATLSGSNEKRVQYYMTSILNKFITSHDPVDGAYRIPLEMVRPAVGSNDPVLILESLGYKVLDGVIRVPVSQVHR
jgi:hypothetical protein